MTVFHLEGAYGTIQAEEELLPSLDSALADLSVQREDFLLAFEGIAAPSACIDGRPSAGSDVEMPVRLAGGTLSLWVGRLLADPSEEGVVFRDTEDAANALGAFCRELHAEGLPVATHRDDHASLGRCGCGAADALGKILLFLSENAEFVASVVDSWGLSVDSSRLARRAAALSPVLGENGLRLYKAIAPHCFPAPPVLLGEHREVALVVNSRPHVLIDRDAVELFLAGRGLAGAQVFIVDAWVSPLVCESLGFSAETAGAIVAFNVAVAMTLCGERMRCIRLT